jgi:carboxylesterase family protein
MKLKLMVLGLCFLATLQWAFIRSQPAGAAATNGSAVAGVDTAVQQTRPVVRVDGGQLQGVVEDAVISYKGIPFAAPPVGDLRWRPPQPAVQWTGVRQAAEFGADCMQARFGPSPSSDAPRPLAPSEDCLFLNLWRPGERRARGKAARDGLDLRGWLHVWLERHAVNVRDPVR